MLEIEQSLKDLYKQDDIHKEVKIYFPSIDLTIENDRIVNGSLSITESICQDEDLVYGSCEASQLSVTVADIIQDIVGLEFTVIQTVEEYSIPLQLGTYIVKSAEKQTNKRLKNIVAYDSMIKTDIDVADWYNGLTWPQTVKSMRESLLTHLGIEYEEQDLINDSVSIKKTVEPSSLIGRDVLKKLCELNAGFGHITRLNKFKVIQLDALGLLPSEILYPSYDLFPYVSSEEIEAGYESIDYEEYIVEPITSITIREDDEDTGATVGTNGNTYIIEGNYLLYEKKYRELQAIASNILTQVENRYYRPYTASMIGLPYLETGDSINLVTNDGIIESFVFKRTLKGIQSLQDEISASGSKKRSQYIGLSTQVKQLKSRTTRNEKNINTLSNKVESSEQKISLVKEEVINKYNELSDTTNNAIAELVSSVDMLYYLSDSATSLYGGEWQDISPERTEGKYIWTKTVTTCSNGEKTESEPICMTGAKGEKGDQGDKGDTGATGAKGDKGDQGEKGDTGATGNGISSITYYYATSTTQTTPSASSITSTTMPSLSSTNKYLWQKEVISYTNGTSKTSVLLIAVYGDQGIQGAKGDTGATGATGTAGKVAKIIPSSNTFKSSDGGSTFSPTQITLTPSLQIVTFTKWQYSINGGSTWVDVTNGSNGMTISSNILTLVNTSALFTSSVTSIVFKLVSSDSSVYDTITIVKLYDVGELENISFTDNGESTSASDATIIVESLDGNYIGYITSAGAYFGEPLEGKHLRVAPDNIEMEVHNTSTTAVTKRTIISPSYILVEGNEVEPGSIEVDGYEVITEATKDNYTYPPATHTHSFFNNALTIAGLTVNGNGTMTGTLAVVGVIKSNNSIVITAATRENYTFPPATHTHANLTATEGNNSVTIYGGNFRTTSSSTNAGDNSVTCGSPSYRWKQVYAATATISTSDERYKKDISLMSDKQYEFFKKLIPVVYKFADNDSNRFHYGFISQDIEKALEECGLTSLDFAGFVKSPIYEDKENETGEIIDYIYGLRYEEFIALNTYIIQRQQKEIEDITTRIEIIEKTLNMQKE